MPRRLDLICKATAFIEWSKQNKESGGCNAFSCVAPVWQVSGVRGRPREDVSKAFADKRSGVDKRPAAGFQMGVP